MRVALTRSAEKDVPGAVGVGLMRPPFAQQGLVSAAGNVCRISYLLFGRVDDHGQVKGRVGALVVGAPRPDQVQVVAAALREHRLVFVLGRHGAAVLAENGGHVDQGRVVGHGRGAADVLVVEARDRVLVDGNSLGVEPGGAESQACGHSGHHDEAASHGTSSLVKNCCPEVGPNDRTLIRCVNILNDMNKFVKKKNVCCKINM